MVTLLYLIATVTEAYTSLPLNSSIAEVHSSSEWKYFELSNPTSISGYVRLTLHYNPYQEHSMALGVQKFSPPEFTISRTDVIADYVDYDGWKLKESHQYIILGEAYLNTTETIIVGVGLTDLRATSKEFILSVEHSLEPLCPNDCSGRGSCNQGSCECDPEYINYDCGTSAELLLNDYYATLDISVGASEYAYFHKGNMKTVKLDFTWTEQALLIAIDWEGHFNVELPTETDYYQQFVLQGGDNSKEMTLEMDRIQGDYIYIGVFNTYNNPTEKALLFLKYTDTSQDENINAVMFVLIGVSAFIIILWIAGGVIRCKINRQRANETEFFRHFGRPTGVPMDIVDRVCPMILFKDAERSQDLTCTICLEQFDPQDNIRRLKCNHIFHAVCIEEWFTANKNCCLCKRDCSIVEDLDVTLDRRNQSMISDFPDAGHDID